MKWLAVRLAACLTMLAALMSGGVASADTTDGYLHSFLTPPRCPFPWQPADPSLTTCYATFFAPSLALTSQSVVLRIGDSESSLADCQAVTSGEKTSFRIDGSEVPVTIIPCRYLPRPIENLVGGVPTPNWSTEFRYVIEAGTLAPGDHTLTWTATCNVDVSYSLGCDEPDGRCTIPAGTVVTSTRTLVIGT